MCSDALDGDQVVVDDGQDAELACTEAAYPPQRKSSPGPWQGR
jgi:hypothetical protein